ncbi:SasC/FmtB family protein [Staphylococcus capitis]|uniref:SasC/FmtB family protein n=1 Tax=Staphylococcus capitis TaxID=29388 RepID=UPI001300907D|nr:SasC/FmtB family protein [Staphylococcus capitis]
MENRRINNLDKKITRFSIRKYQGFGAASVAIIGIFMMSNINFAKADSIEENNTTINQKVNDSTSHQINIENQKSVNDKLTNNQDIENKLSSTETNTQHVINTSQLEKILNQYKSLDLSNKTEDSVELFRADLQEAESILNNPQSQQQVDDYYHKFLNSAGKLHNKESLLPKRQSNGVQSNHSATNNSVSNHSHIRHKRDTSSFRSAPENNVSNDPLKANEVNPEIQNGNFSQVSGGTLPSRSKRLTVVTNVDNWHSYSTDPNPEYPMFYTPSAVDYPSFMSNGGAPYGVVVARTNNGSDRSVNDPKVAGIYQDIDVIPGSELNVNFISTSPAFSDGAAGAKLKISNVDQSRVLFDSRLNGMGPYPTGKLSAMVNIPNDMNRVRISFLPISSTGRISVQRSSREHGFGDNSSYYHGGSVSDVRINSGSYITSNVTQVEYTTQPNSPNDNLARATVNLSVENKGHNQSRDTYYEVILPANSKLISSNGVSANLDTNSNKLRIWISNLNPGDRKDVSYTIDFEAMRPKVINLNAHITYKTNATFRGSDSQRNGDNTVNLQTVTIQMNKTELQSKVNEVDNYLHDLNEADFTADSWRTLQDKLTEARNIINEQQNNVAIENQASQETINNVTNSLDTLKNSLKYNAPSKPIIEINQLIPNLTITPANKADKLNVTYQNTANERTSIIATKTNDNWSLDNSVPGINIEPQSGLVTNNYQAVYPESVVVANDIIRNSDTSEESRENMPRKEATPESPDIEASEEHVNVEVTPKGEASKIEIIYINPEGEPASINAIKNGETWTLDKQVSHINIDDHTGKVTVGYQAVQAESEIVATETKGNSDSSSESKLKMPRKETTPEAPDIESNVEHVNVEVTPKGESTKLEVKYTDTNGQPSSIIANKNGGVWALNKEVPHIELDETTGKVTVGYQAVQAESEVVAIETKGNSDVSTESKVTMPRKEATPDSPAIEASEEYVNVEVTPKDESTKLVINYTNPEGHSDSIIANKNGGAWLLNKQVPHIVIDDRTGKVTIGHQAVQAESEIIATETKGNSDVSTESKVTMPRKETTPEAPDIESNVEHVNVEVTPKGESTKLKVKYTDTNGQLSTFIANKNGETWSLNKQVSYIGIDDRTGKVTIGYQAVQAESEIIATETKGNSDVSTESKVTMPRKEATPHSPSIEVSEEHVNVEVTPKDESTKLMINYTNTEGQSDTIIVSKNGEVWSLNKNVPHIEVDEATGKVTIGYQAVQAESEVITIETKGNSDSSPESKVTMPRKEVTPNAPIVEKEESNASVNILPQDEVTKLVVKYIAPEGEPASITASKTGGTWSLNKQVPHIQLNDNTGKITIGYQAVQVESEISATEKKGNSDSSLISKVIMPRKEATPNSPVIEASEERANVEVTPRDESTKLVINYTKPDGQSDTIIVSKNGETWSLNKNVPHTEVDETTGKITIGYQAVQVESEISATETKGNSDSSLISKVTMPRKEVAPEGPVLKSDHDNASVSIIPSINSDKITIKYLDVNDQIATAIATKKNQSWSLNNNISGISINSQTGTVTISYVAVQPESDITATASNGNSDNSISKHTIMPAKEVKPQPPVVRSNIEEANVEIIPHNDVTRLDVHYVDLKGQPATITATKVGNGWTINKNISNIKLDESTGKLTMGHQAVLAESEVVATETKGNSDESAESKINMPRKEVTPESPAIEANEEHVNVEVTPKGESTKLVINYTNSDGQPDSIITIKIGETWSLNKDLPNIRLDEHTGKVTIGHQAVQAESEIVATETKGNSDTSAESKVTMPRKEVTPESPAIEANEEHVNVEVTPKGESTKVVINYTNPEGQPDSITASKKEGTWSLNKEVPHLELDEHTGKVTIGHQAVLAESEIVATETKGNSEVSAESKINMPRKEVTPDSPVIEANEERVNVEVTPKGESTKLIINYTNPEGQPDSIIVIKKEEIWSLNKEVPHIELDEHTGKVTLGHQAVLAESEIVATETKGNSNTSPESKVTMPRKESTPDSPTIEASEEHASVKVTPKGESTKLIINYTNSEGQPDSIIASKKEGTWSLNKETPHIEINDHTGKVTIGYQAVQAESEIVATETKGNSDASAESKINMPRKEVTPDSPVIEANEERVNVEVTPKGESTKLVINYTNSDGQPDTIIASKDGFTWSLSKDITGITIKPATGKVTIDYHVVYPESEITASEVHGNSDHSKLNSVIMPRKENAPEPPIVTVNEKEATVIIKPKIEATKVEITFKNKKGKSTYINVYKNGSDWSVDQVMEGIILNSHTGEIKITHLAFKDGSEIIAREYKGNSDASIAISIKAPTKVTSKESYKIKSSKVKLNDRSNEKMYTKKDKLIELPHTGESEKANKTLLSSILILGLMLLRKSRKKEI